MNKTSVIALLILICSGLSAQSNYPTHSLDSLSLFEVTYRLLGREMIITNSYKPNNNYGVILIEEDHTEQRSNTLFLSRLIGQLNVRKVGLEGQTFSIDIRKSLVPNEFPMEKGLVQAFLYEHLMSAGNQEGENSYQLSNAEFLYLNFDSMELVPIEEPETYDRFDNELFESPAYYMQTAGVDILKKKEIDSLSEDLAVNWICTQKNTTVLRSTREYLKIKKQNYPDFYKKLDELIVETIAFNLNSMDRDTIMVGAIEEQLTKEQILPVIIGASHTYNMQRLLRSLDIPHLTVMGTTTARRYSSLKKTPPRLVEVEFNKHIEESILELLISHSLSDTSLFQNDEYYRNLCRDFKYIDNQSIQIKQRTKSQPDVIRYNFRWRGREYLNNGKIMLNSDDGKKSMALSEQDELSRLRTVSITLQNQMDSIGLWAPPLATNFKNYERVLHELTNNYVQKIIEWPKDESPPLNEQVVSLDGQDHFLYHNYVTYNGRLNFCEKTERENGIDVISGVFTRYYDRNIKDLYSESGRIFDDLHEFFQDSTVRIADLGIHIIISTAASKNKSKYSKEKVQKKLDRELEMAKERLKSRGIKCNLFLRIDYI